MRGLLISTFTIALTISANSQLDKQIQHEITALRLSKVDTFLIYSSPCPGSVVSFWVDTCPYEAPQYLFWKQDASYYLKKFDLCKNYKAVLLDTINPLSFYLAHSKQIDKEEIKIPTYVQSKKGNVITEISSTIDHTCFYEMVFLLRNKKVSKKISDYDLTTIKFDNGKCNIYYSQNQQTKLKKLIDLFKQLEIDKKFEVP